jgi:hypothetical protein
MNEDLQHDLCPYCWEWHDRSMGLIPFIMKTGCDANVVIYRRSSFTFRKFKNIIAGIVDDMQPFKELLQFTYLKKMPNFDTATELEKKIYRICRESDIRSGKRMKQYIKQEEELLSKY